MGTRVRLTVHVTPDCFWHYTVVDEVRVWVSGGAFLDGRYVDSAALADTVVARCSQGMDEQPIPALLRELNGFFAFVAQGDGWLAAGVDRVRSIPLYHAQRDDQVWISNDSLWMLDAIGNRELDAASVREFYILGYTTGAHTLSASVKQLEVGQWLESDTRGSSPVQPVGTYALWKHHTADDVTEEALLEQGQRASLGAVQRLVARAAGRQIVVPLSGGLDSRLIATLLRRLEYERVVCFSYGLPGNREAEVSRQVAASLGYPWVLVPYSRALWHTWYASSQWREYAAYAGGISAKPHLQDWPAVWRLREEQRIADDAVFAPGHIIPTGTANLAWRGLYERGGPPDRDEVLQVIYHMHYALQRPAGSRRRLSEELRARVFGVLGDLEAYEDSADAYEVWQVHERHAKFIVNSVRVYEFWGYDWWLPLWDAELMAFWAGVPATGRVGRTLHRRLVRRLYEDTAGERAFKETVTAAHGHGRLKAAFRHSAVAPLYRLAIRIPEYWNEPRAWFGIVSLWTYLRTVLEPDSLAGPGFGVNSFLVRDQLKMIRDRLA